MRGTYLSDLWDVLRFELGRSRTFGRVALWLILVIFPVVITAILRWQIPVNRIEPWGTMLYFLVPEVICLLGLLLWATPSISSELEGQTWIYLATRPRGRTLVVLGKYATAVLWTFSAAAVAIAACSCIIGGEDAFGLWWKLTALAWFSCIAHGALYLLIGLLAFRRTMVAAVIYTVVVEFGLSFVPAVVNQLTINYRLRGLLAGWTDWQAVRSLAEISLGVEPTSHHLIGLGIATGVFLVAAIWRVRTAEFPTQQDGGS